MHVAGGAPAGLTLEDRPVCRRTGQHLQLIAALDFGTLLDAPSLGTVLAWSPAGVEGRDAPCIYRAAPSGRSTLVIHSPLPREVGRTPSRNQLPVDVLTKAPNAGLGATLHRVGGSPVPLNQRPTTPACPSCARPMAFLAQFDRDDDAGWRFGPTGTLLLHGCFGCRCFATSVDDFDDL